MYILAFDIEVSGSSLTRNGILSIGASLWNEKFEELDYFQRNLLLPEGRTYEDSCKKNFWDKNLDAAAFVASNALDPKQVMQEFEKFLNNIY
jgi:hypothetical protein